LDFIRNKTGDRYLSEMIPKLLYDAAFINQLLLDMSVTVTEMFRDPDFFNELRAKVIPLLKTYPFVKIWHTGCATGEEVYSMAILLKEEGFYDRVQIYATDMNQESLHQKFGEMHVIICRNVLIYFNRDLQNKVLRLFDQSLIHRGFLCLGSKESLEFTDISIAYENVSAKWRVYQQKLQ
jgi:chemotaxis protein methyltransferase CheR